MVHQLSLVASIPHSSYLQTIATLQAITGQVQPQQISTYTLIAKPNHVFKPKFEPGKINQIEQYFMKCTTTWSSFLELDLSKPVLNNKINGTQDIIARKLFIEEEKTSRDNDCNVGNSKDTIERSEIVDQHCLNRHGLNSKDTIEQSEISEQHCLHCLNRHGLNSKDTIERSEISDQHCLHCLHRHGLNSNVGNSKEKLASEGQFGNEKVWTFQICDIPIAGKNQSCSQQTIYESTLIHTHIAVDSQVENEIKVKLEKKQSEAEAEGEAEQNFSKKSQEEETDAMQIDSMEGGKGGGNAQPAIKSEDEPKTELKIEPSTAPKTDPSMVPKTEPSTAPKTEPSTAPKTEPSTAPKTEPSTAPKTEPSTAPKTEPSTAPKTVTKRRNDSFLIFLNDLGYSVINQYWVKGVRFFYGDIIIELFKVFIRDDSQSEDDDRGIKLKLLDDSNTFQIKCYINIAKSTEIELINQGVKHLGHLQDLIKGLFLLEISDRSFLDSRVTNVK
ncbi:SRB5 [Candida oxycetoniae]|uniref:Mediator of RNA polymerase II transcription subunit 18 n=1 Tax=Candida oxycetoniae TaxID=497107 RepID=A0AAI9SUT2_9ASCO|nr:SRB5 [Candida oxycetoniae]KAI3403438.2 SRB5 [Candida oxycetoniae]